MAVVTELNPSEPVQVQAVSARDEDKPHSMSCETRHNDQTEKENDWAIDDVDDDDEDWDDDWDSILRVEGKEGKDRGSSVPEGTAGVAAKQAQLQRLQARVNFDPLPISRSPMGHAALNSVVSSEKKAAVSRHQGLTQDTRATVEQVLDPRTMLVLSKFLKRGIFTEIHGCISTGKEANVYYATTPDKGDRAVKVYKTSILVFKDRARYVEGEYRFKGGYAKGNPRKMVAQWAEKELRNLRRLKAAGVPCPEVFEVRQNVLVMEFVGHEGNAAPRLKDVEGLLSEEWLELYCECALLMRRMMQNCRLVHGDLSEYNMLYLDGSLVIIDVSQSVESDHPQSLDFLKRDCVNVNSFFGRRIGRPVVPVRLLFDFVVTRQLVMSDGQGYFGEKEDEEAFQALLKQTAEGMTEGDEADDEVFVQTWVPSHLDQVSDRGFIERELDKRERGEEVLYERLLAGKQKDADEAEEDNEDESNSDADAGAEIRTATASAASKRTGRQKAPAKTEHGADQDSDDGSEDDEEEDGNHADGHRPEGIDKHEWKAKVKEERRLKRLEKVPKALKKKFKKQAAKGR